jgi:glycosyltransferase involved in cell wall biosynthesis
MKELNIAILDMVPTHYRIPIYSKLSKEKIIKTIIYFSSSHGIKKSFSPAFNTELKMNNNLSEINYKFLKNYYPDQSTVRVARMWNFGIIKEIIKNKFDAIVIISYTPFSHKLAMITAKLTGIPVILKEEIDLHKQPKGTKGFLKQIFLRIIIRSSDGLLYGYKKNKEFFKHYNAKEKNLFFFPCAVDNEMFQKQKQKLPKKELLKKELGFSKNDFIGIFIGRLIKQKNVLHLIQAIKNLQNKKIPAGLIIVGEGDQREMLKNYVKKNKIKKIKFAGFKQQRELGRYIKASDISLLASSEDRSPKSLNETMNFGLPAIVTNYVKTAPDLVKIGKTGFVYPVGDITKLSKYIEKLYRDKILYKKMSKNTNILIKKWNFNKDIEGLLKAVKYVR